MTTLETTFRSFVTLAVALLLAFPASACAEEPAGGPQVVGSRLAGATAGGGPGAQVVEPDQGVVGTALRLRQLDGVKRVLLIAAHPDDEDTSLITALARGWGAEVAYLSLSRGEGGQNLIGPELDEGLGIVRTGELLAARRLDGGLQLFSRAFDFGYSKSAEETFQYWPREEVLADVVWMVRKFRPQVVVSIFPPDARAGHGQHEVAGIVAHEAFEVAGDPQRFPEQLEGPDAVDAWSPVKLYRSARFNPGSASAELPTGAIDPLLGRSHHQLAMASRSQHRSQDMGTDQDMGPRNTYLELVESRSRDAVAAGEGGVFAGVDTALASVATALPAASRDEVDGAIQRYRELLGRAVSTNPVVDPDATAMALSRAVRSLRGALDAVGSGSGSASVRRVLEKKLAVAEEAILSASRVVVDARTRDDLVVPGETLDVEVTVWNGGGLAIDRAEPSLDLPEGWSARVVEEPPESGGGRGFRSGPDFGGPDYQRMTGAGSVAPGSLARWTFRVQVPDDSEPSRPYFLEQERDGEMYRWPADRSLWGLPRNPPIVTAAVAVVLNPESAPDASDSGGTDTGGTDSGDTDTGPGGTEAGPDGIDLQVERPAEYVGVDDATGEFRTPLLVAPALSVQARPGIMAWPLDQQVARPVTVAIRNQARNGFRGRLLLEAPAGWTVDPGEVSLELEAPGEDRSVTFQVTPGSGAEAGLHELRAVAVSDEGTRYAEGFDIIDYPHIDRDLLFADAVTRVSMFPVRVDEDLRVGYVMGSGDGGAEALSQIGAEVTLLGADAVREGAFEDFDVILLGVRAYETRPDLVGANQQLLDWVRDGGRLIVQYNRYEFSGAGYAPYPVTIDRPHDRVTYEDAPVTLLDPESPVFTRPNRIEAADFEGWAQERGLYFLHDWDERYTPLVEMSDPGEDPLRGSLLITPLGEGLWTYTGIAFFRQFPEGVPGAYRLLANLVSLEPGEWRAHHGTAARDPGDGAGAGDGATTGEVGVVGGIRSERVGGGG